MSGDGVGKCERACCLLVRSLVGARKAEAAVRISVCVLVCVCVCVFVCGEGERD